MALKLRELREQAGYSQKDAADALGVKVRTYGSWEREEVRMSLEQAFDVSRLFNCTLDDLVGLQKKRELTLKEELLIRDYRLLSDIDKSILERIATALKT